MRKTFLLFSTLLLFIGCGRSDVENGNICLNLGDYEMAEYFFRKVLYKDPADYGARVGMGKALLQRASAQHSQKDSLWERGLVHLEAAQNLNPVQDLRPLLSQVWFQRSNQLLNSGDTSGSLNALTRAIEYDSENIDALNSAGILYFRLGEPSRAKRILNRALLIDSLNTALFFNLGMIHFQQDDISRAHNYWLSALRNSPEDEELMYWFAMAEKKMRGDSE